MSTHSFIGKVDENSKHVKGIYCHSDGYIESVGFILYTFYNTPEKIDELISLGDLSRLGIRIGDKFDYDTSLFDYEAHKNQCVAYCRDRGEDLHIYRSPDLQSILSVASEAYNYIYKDEQWYVYENKWYICRDDVPQNNSKPLKDVLKNNIEIKSEVFQKRLFEDESYTEEERKAIEESLDSLGVLIYENENMFPDVDDRE